MFLQSLAYNSVQMVMISSLKYGYVNIFKNKMITVSEVMSVMKMYCNLIVLSCRSVLKTQISLYLILISCKTIIGNFISFHKILRYIFV